MDAACFPEVRIGAAATTGQKRPFASERRMVALGQVAFDDKVSRQVPELTETLSVLLGICRVRAKALVQTGGAD